jgi:hypothetical protein
MGVKWARNCTPYSRLGNLTYVVRLGDDADFGVLSALRTDCTNLHGVQWWQRCGSHNPPEVRVGER